MFYDKFVKLCEARNISPSKAAVEAGISKSLVSKWKANESAFPSMEVAHKLADYFEIAISELLDDSSAQKEKTTIPLNSSLDQIGGTYLRLARGAQELGLDDEDVDAILAIYAKHKKKNM